MVKARPGVRTRILAIAVVPSVALLGIGVGTAGYLVREGQHAKDWASTLGHTNVHTREFIDATEQERALSIWQAAGIAQQPGALAAARARMDNSLRELQDVQDQFLAHDGSRLGDRAAEMRALRQQLPGLRQAIDGGALHIPEIYAIYNRIVDGVTLGISLTIDTAPDAAVARELGGGSRTLHAIEALSRGAALTGPVLTGRNPGTIGGDYNNLVGYYRTELPQLGDDLKGPGAEKIKAVVNSPLWKQLGDMENYLIRPPAPDRAGNLAPPPMSFEDWRRAAEQVGNDLLVAWQYQIDRADALAAHDGSRTATNSLWAGAGVLATAIAAFLLSLWLANRLIGRLRRLRTETLALAEIRLPDTMRRLDEGEDIDPEIEAARLDFGNDEIGAVARAFNRAHTAAVAAAVTEARTRAGVRAVFLNIAHRSQLVVHRQLEILDEAERGQEDPLLLDTLFRLDHLATRERRNAENLILLGGGEPGRRWLRPVPLVEVVRSAIGETLDYARVDAGRMPKVSVLGSVVADLIHLLAELVDNATSFSPPHSRVEVRAGEVGKGVAIDITDQGVGMTAEEFEQANRMLADPPDFGVATLSEDSRMGLFVVAQLGARHGISVRLSESDYGGVRAVVLVPDEVVATAPPEQDHLPGRFGRHDVPWADTGEFATVDAPAPAPRRALPMPRALSLLPPPAAAAAPRTDWFASPADPPAPPPHTDWFASAADAAAPLEAGGEHAAIGARPVPAEDDTAARGEYPALLRFGDCRPPLPRRRRQTSLAPQLLQEDPPRDPPRSHAGSAERARDLMSAIENGTRQGRTARPAGGRPLPDEQEGAR
ncbi:MAG: sensor histidine kinase [Nocardia sp.]|nr:sensor histidine kinase [Nocardia sp.]